MKLGIMYDTPEMYGLTPDNLRHRDFCSEYSAERLRTQFEKAGYDVTMIGNMDSLFTKIRNNSLDVDIIYNTVEGLNTRNREGTVPAFLEWYGIPFMGTDSYGLSTSLDKGRTKMIASNLGIPTPDYVMYDTDRNICGGNVGSFDSLHYPIIIKPNYEGNSTGVIKIDNPSAARYYIDDRLSFFRQDILCEEFIFGYELTVAIIGTGKNSRVVSMAFTDKQIKSGDLTYWQTSDEKVYGDYKDVEANLDDDVRERIEDYSLKIYKALGCRDFGRVDFRLDANGNPFFLEINPIPSLAENGAFGLAASNLCLEYHELLDLMIRQTSERYPYLSFPEKKF